MESGGPTIEALPDQLLGAIVALAGKQAGPSLTLVSKRLQRLVYSEPTFWRSFRLTKADQCLMWWERTQRFASSEMPAAERQQRSQRRVGRLHTLERTAHMVQEAALDVDMLRDAGRAGSRRQVLKWLGVLKPGVLTALSLDFATVRESKVKERALAAVAELLRFTRLQRLELDGVATPAHVLGRLPQLRSLSLRGGLDTAASAAVFIQLTQLQLSSWRDLRDDWALVLPTLQHLRSLSVRAANIPAPASLMQLTQLRELVIESGNDQGVPEQWALVLPTLRHLSSLSVRAAYIPSPASLMQLTQLRELVIDSSAYQAVPEQWALVLPTLRHLSSLSLHAKKIPAAVWASMAQLTQLGELSLSSYDEFNEGPAEALSELRHLSLLSSFDLHFICDSYAEAACVAQLTVLKSLRISGGFHVGDRSMLLPLTSLRNLERLEVSLPYFSTTKLPVLSDFPALKAYSLRCDSQYEGGAPIMEFAGSTIEECVFTICGDEAFDDLQYVNFGGFAAGSKVLAVGGLHQSCALQLLLSALLPGGMASTDTFVLVLDSCNLDASMCAQSPLLARVLHLQLRHYIFYHDEYVDEVCSVLLRQAPRLTSLLIEQDVGSSVPACIRRLCGLTSLSLVQQYRLRDVPPGPYLTGLTSLTLGTHRLTHLPHSLVAAQRLQRLVLGLQDDGDHGKLVLAKADVDGVLLRLPRLELIVFGGPAQHTSVLDRLLRGAPNLVVRCLNEGEEEKKERRRRRAFFE